MGVARSANGHAIQGRADDGDLLNQFLAAIGRWAAPRTAVLPWSSGVGLARTVLALGTAATLAATRPSMLVSSLPPVGAAAGTGNGSACSGATAAGMFCALPAWHGELARWSAVAVLLLVTSGWRPRLTAVPHWYVSWSLVMNGAVVDGGDQVTANLTLLLIPVLLTDSRRWHWQRPAGAAASVSRGGAASRAGVARVVAYAGLLLIQLQVAVVYFQSSVAKLGVQEWADGTAMFYFFQHPLFGAPPWLRPLTDAVTGSGPGVAVVTWAPITVEFALALGILLRPPAKRVLLMVGLVFHASIALAMGLVSFDAAMSGALLLYLLPIGHHVRFAVPATVARLTAAGRPSQHDEALA